MHRRRRVAAIFAGAKRGHRLPHDLRPLPAPGLQRSNSAFAPFDGLLDQQKNHPDGVGVPKNPPFSVADTMDETKLPVHKPPTPDGEGSAHHVEPDAGIPTRSVEGYVVHAKAGGVESCNCDIATKSVLDTHINVVDKPKDPNVDPKTLPGVSLIAEITWRVRKSHADWTVANLQKLDLQHRARAFASREICCTTTFIGT